MSGGHPVTWSPGALINDLKLPEGAAIGWAAAINERNQLAVNVIMKNGRWRSLRWTAGEGYRFLPMPPGATLTLAHGIDDHGNVYARAPGTFFGWENFVVWVGVTPRPLADLSVFEGIVESAEGCGYATGGNLLFKNTACP